MYAARLQAEITVSLTMWMYILCRDAGSLNILGLQKLPMMQKTDISGHYRGKDWQIQRLPAGMNSLHVEYDYCYLRPEDCIDISTENDSFYCYPTKKNAVTKLGFAVEAAYQLHQAKIAEKKAARKEK